MKRLLLLVALLLVAGCAKQEPEPQPNFAPVQPEPQPAPQEPLNEQAPPRSQSFLSGYRDGYNGNWLAPGRWTVVNDYRHGWSLGNQDRREGRQPRYPLLVENDE